LQPDGVEPDKVNYAEVQKAMENIYPDMEFHVMNNFFVHTFAVLMVYHPATFLLSK